MRGRAELSDLVGRDLVRGVSVPCDAEPEISAVRGGSMSTDRSAPATKRCTRFSASSAPIAVSHTIVLGAPMLASSMLVSRAPCWYGPVWA